MTRFGQSKFSVGYGDTPAYRDHWQEMFGCEGLLPDTVGETREECAERPVTTCGVCGGRRCAKHRCKCGR